MISFSHTEVLMVTYLGDHAVLDKPPRRFRQEIDEYKYDQRWKQLNADRSSPLDLTADVKEAPRHKLTARHTESLQTAFDHDCDYGQ